MKLLVVVADCSNGPSRAEAVALKSKTIVLEHPEVPQKVGIKITQ